MVVLDQNTIGEIEPYTFVKRWISGWLTLSELESLLEKNILVMELTRIIGEKGQETEVLLRINKDSI